MKCAIEDSAALSRVLVLFRNQLSGHLSKFQVRRPKPHQGPPLNGRYCMKKLLVAGITLIGLGIVSLACFASPIRLMVQDAGSQRMNPAIPVAGAIALICGIAIVYAVRPRS